MEMKTFFIEDLNILEELKIDLKNTLTMKISESNVRAKRTSWYYYTEENGKKIFDKLKKYFKDLNIVECWGNCYKKGDFALVHNHTSKFANAGNFDVCGIIYLNDSITGTYFEDLNETIKAECGKVLLFNPKKNHSVPKIEDDERYTISFNARYNLLN